MASNYTTNYELPLWEPQDSFLRTEFNEAHQKIDDALAENLHLFPVHHAVFGRRCGGVGDPVIRAGLFRHIDSVPLRNCRDR